jgi:hypothetical protein
LNFFFFFLLKIIIKKYLFQQLGISETEDLPSKLTTIGIPTDLIEVG